MAALDKKNAVLADKCYCDNQLAAEDVSINLPAVTFLTSEVNAMGKMDVVLGGLIEKPRGKATLVPESDKRPAMDFSDFTNDEEDEGD